ncbi:MAG: GNAT family N-acetyltransferase [Bradymonadia bacterium]
MNWRRRNPPGTGIRRLTFEDLDVVASDFNDWVARSPDIDQFCSSADWLLPAQHALTPEAEPFILATDDGYIALMAFDVPSLGRTLTPLEHAWGLACPLVGPDPRRLVEHLFYAVTELPIQWDALWLSGLKEEGEGFYGVVQTFYPQFTVGVGPSTLRRSASITEGPEAFLAERSSKFRATLRRSVRKAQSEGLSYQGYSTFTPREVDAVFERIINVEGRSWKGQSGQGMDSPPSSTFYYAMLQRLAARGALRVGFLSQGHQDVAYIFGGIFESTYRGLQFSFDDVYRPLSLGNVIQWHMIEQLCAEGIGQYDLGTDMAYKQRWGVEDLKTNSLVVFKERRR